MTTKNKKLKRLPVQLAINNDTVIVLANDGTMWSSSPAWRGWMKLVNLPQNKKDKNNGKI